MSNNNLINLIIFTALLWLILDQIFGRKHIGNFARLLVDSFSGGMSHG